MSELLKMGRPNVSRCASDEGRALQNGDDPQRGIKTEDKPDGGQKVVLVGVKKCDACDENGKIIPNIECDLCETASTTEKTGLRSNAESVEKSAHPALLLAVSPTAPHAAANVTSKSIVLFAEETR